MDILYIGKHNKMFNVEQHSHIYGEIIYCTGGEGTFINRNNEETRYSQGNAILVPPNYVHSNTSGQGFSNFFMAVTNTNQKMPPGIVCIQDNERQDLYKCIEQAHFYFNCKTENREAILGSLSELILHYLMLFSGRSGHSRYTNEIKQHIISNFSQPDYRPSDFILQLPFNCEYLCKKFTLEVGMSPSQYLSKIRISHAKKMLHQQQEYGLSIKEISIACGFFDPLYFSRVFKTATGISPSKFSQEKNT